jgi:hypothetical protein
MNGGLILFLIVIVSIIIFSYLTSLYNGARTKAVEDVEKELKLSDKIVEAKAILSKNKYFSDIAFTDSASYNEYSASDKTIGHCPKCKTGYLQVSKRFTGLDDVYGRYPTYKKFLQCYECAYTENYINLKKRRSNAKLSMSAQLKDDFNEAYKIR